MIGFIISILPYQKTTWVHQQARTCTKPKWTASAFDELPPSLKLNAVAEAVARKRDYKSTDRLLSEMSSSGVKLEQSALTAIIDSATRSPEHLASFLLKINPSGYNSSFPSIQQASPNYIVDPERFVDISFASGFLGVVGTCVSAEILEPPLVHHSADEATTVLILVLSALAFDRYAASAVTWTRIQAGLVRLFANDPARESHVDAACFLVAYLLGLPWVCFRPDVSQVVKWLDRYYGNKQVENLSESNEGLQRKSWGPDSGTELDKYLVWLVSGVAAEDKIDGRLITSAVRPAHEFLRRARARCGTEITGKASEADKKIGIAIAQAKDLLKKNQRVHEVLANNMLQGKSVGQCVALVAELLSTEQTTTVSTMTQPETG